MKKIITSLCYVSLMVCLLFVTSCDEDEKVSIMTLSGIVSDEAGEALEGITITLGEFSTLTNNIGYYYFTIKTSGTYTLNIEEDGYEAFTKEINLETGKDLEENIQLVKKDDENKGDGNEDEDKDEDEDEDEDKEEEEDEANTFILDLKGLLQEKESEYLSNDVNGEISYQDEYGTVYTSTFQDNSKLFVFNNFSANWTGNFSLSGAFTYTNKTDITNPTSIAAITGAGVDGDTYLTAYADDYTYTYMKFAEDASYKIKGCYITNTTYTYSAIKNGNGIARPFEKEDYFRIIFIGKKDGKETAKVEYDLAKDGNIVDTWEWVALTDLGEIDELNFKIESTDVGEWGINTPTYFSLDGIKIAK